MDNSIVSHEWLMKQIESLQNELQQVKTEAIERERQALEREKQAIEREKRLMALLENQSSRDSSGGLFGKLFK